MNSFILEGNLCSGLKLPPVVITLRAKDSGAVYCNRSCLRVTVFATGGRVGRRADGRCPNLTTVSARNVCVSLSVFFIILRGANVRCLLKIIFSMKHAIKTTASESYVYKLLSIPIMHITQELSIVLCHTNRPSTAVSSHVTVDL